MRLGGAHSALGITHLHRSAGQVGRRVGTLIFATVRAQVAVLARTPPGVPLAGTRTTAPFPARSPHAPR